MKTPFIPTFVLAGLLLAGPIAWASGEKPAHSGQPMIKEKIVIVDKDGKENVFESSGMSVRRGYLGVGLTDLTSELRTHFGAPEDAGVMVGSVEEGSPAAKAGIRVGDIIVSLDGKDVKSSWDIRSQIRQVKEGEQVPMTLYRNGKAQNLSAAIVLRERPELDMAPLLVRGDGEHGPMTLQLDRERLHMPMMPGVGGPDADKMIVRRMGSPREAELEKRLKELEKRLAELEKLLEKK